MQENANAIGRTHSTQRPEQIAVHRLVRDDDIARRRHNLHLEHLVRCKPVERTERTMSSAGDIATNTNRVACSTDKRKIASVCRAVDVAPFLASAERYGVKWLARTAALWREVFVE